MFEQLRHSLNELLERATAPEDRRIVAARMKGTLVQAKLGVDDLRDALASTRRRLEAERRELETVRRRRQLAGDINDVETVSIAERYEKQHEEKARVLEEKIGIQERELELADRELEEMKTEFRRALAGASPALSTSLGADPFDEVIGEPARTESEIDALARARAREDREADAARRLEELKRKMGQ